MNIVLATGAYGAIRSALETSTNVIEKIEVTQEEMDEFLQHPSFSMYSIDKNYAGYEIEVPLGMKTHNSKVYECWYKQTRIVVA